MSKEEKIKDAFNKFEDGKFIEAENKLKKVFKKAVNDHLKNNLKLKKDVFDVEDVEDKKNKNEE
jgi:hypothetical protein